MSESVSIIYTRTDEAPALATYSLLPVVRGFAAAAGIEVKTRDISLAGRVLAAMAPWLPEEQRVEDELGQLGALTQDPAANIVKLPNISASVPQLEATIAELGAKGYALPSYPREPEGEEERRIRAAYDAVKGSAVNPVLREGNSDRRAPRAVKEFARKHPHSMGAWSAASRTHVATMKSGDFRSNERSYTAPSASTLRIVHRAEDGTETTLKGGIAVDAGHVVDATFMSRKALLAFLREQIADAQREGLLWSLHLKATMMKVSDPILFGHAVRTYFAEVFERHGAALARAGVDPNNGLGDLLAKAASLPEEERAAIERDVTRAMEQGPALAIVDSDRGITNLHVPSDVIIDASMPAMIRTSGQMWNRQGEQQDTKAVIPDSSYAGVYQVVIDSCREHGAFDPRTMGSCPNVGLMAQKAEEYGSHDKTFELAAAGVVQVIDASGQIRLEHRVEAGDVWRMCLTRQAAVVDWVELAIRRARATGVPAVFWLDEARAHDRELIALVSATLATRDVSGLELPILSPVKAAAFTVERLRAGLDTISVTGNVLRDYLTDLFPILELGTSAKMLSIVPLMAGGGLFETGAGGSAPKHVQQLVAQNYLRWDSLGEFLALAASFEHVADTFGHASARVLATTLDQATAQVLENGRSPARRLGQIDNRGSHFYLALYWAQALAAQRDDAGLAAHFAPVAQALEASEAEIVRELLAVQGQPADIGGYYLPDPARAEAVMRPSPTFNRILDSLTAA